MNTPDVKQINSVDQNQQLIQNNTATALKPIQNSPFVGGVQLNNIVLKSGSNAVQHTLGRTPTLWVICDTNAAQTVFRTTWDKTVINLTASGTVTISLWVN